MSGVFEVLVLQHLRLDLLLAKPLTVERVLHRTDCTVGTKDHIECERRPDVTVREPRGACDSAFPLYPCPSLCVSSSFSPFSLSSPSCASPKTIRNDCKRQK